MSESGSKRRDRAAAARNAAQADERRRERLVRIIGAVTVVVVVVGIIAVAVIARGSSDSSQTVTPTEIIEDAAIPNGVLAADSSHPFGVPYGTAAADAPVLEVWEDFQCPACAAVEQANGAGIAALAEEGEVQLIWRPATFLDRVNDGGDPAVANSSSRAVAAWGCAIDQGKVVEFHDALFANHPEVEGDGYTDEQLAVVAGDAGIEGADLEAFQTCVAEGTYLDWATNAGVTFSNSGAGGTPYATLDGVVIENPILADDAALREFIANGGAAAGDEATAE